MMNNGRADQSAQLAAMQQAAQLHQREYYGYSAKAEPPLDAAAYVLQRRDMLLNRIASLKSDVAKAETELAQVERMLEALAK